MPNVYGIFGAGGNGSELLPILKNNLLNSSLENQKIFFIDDKTSKNKFYGMDVITRDEFKGIKNKTKKVVISIADSKIR